MTRQEKLQELRQALRKLTSDGYDPESAHSQADDLLLNFINDDEVKAAYEDIEKWYA